MFQGLCCRFCPGYFLKQNRMFSLRNVAHQGSRITELELDDFNIRYVFVELPPAEQSTQHNVYSYEMHQACSLPLSPIQRWSIVHCLIGNALFHLAPLSTSHKIFHALQFSLISILGPMFLKIRFEKPSCIKVCQLTCRDAILQTDDETRMNSIFQSLALSIRYLVSVACWVWWCRWHKGSHGTYFLWETFCRLWQIPTWIPYES